MLVGGPTCGPPARFTVHLASSAVTPAGYVHKYRGNNVVRIWVQLKEMMCVVCYRESIVVTDVFGRRLCVNMI